MSDSRPYLSSILEACLPDNDPLLPLISDVPLIYECFSNDCCSLARHLSCLFLGMSTVIDRSREVNLIPRIGFIGGGGVSQRIVSDIIECTSCRVDIVVSSPESKEWKRSEERIMRDGMRRKQVLTNIEAVEMCDVVVLAFPPSQLPLVGEEVSGKICAHAIVYSCLCGVVEDQVKRYLRLDENNVVLRPKIVEHSEMKRMKSDELRGVSDQQIRSAFSNSIPMLMNDKELTKYEKIGMRDVMNSIWKRNGDD